MPLAVGGIKAASILFGLIYWVDGGNIHLPEGGTVGWGLLGRWGSWRIMDGQGPREDPRRGAGFEKKRELANVAKGPNQERLKTQ